MQAVWNQFQACHGILEELLVLLSTLTSKIRPSVHQLTDV